MITNSTSSVSQQKLAKILFVAGGLLLIVVVWTWWHFVYANPERAFYAAIDNSLRTRGVSKVVTQEANGQKLDQKLQITTGPEHLVRGVTTIGETGQSSTTIKTEAIGTPKQDYVRYTTIHTDQKGESGQTPDFSKLLNMWGRSETSGKTTNGQLYSEAVLGVVPIGNLPAAERTRLMKDIKSQKVYKFDESKVAKKLENGRPVYTYSVTVAPEAYIDVLKQFAAASGLTQLENINPANYKSAPEIRAKISIDAWSREITGLQYTEGDRKEKIGSYGVVADLELPDKSIPIETLQQRLQNVQ